MAPTPSRRLSTLTPRQVVDRVMELIAAFPEIVHDLPEKMRTRTYWVTLLAPNSERGARVMEVLRELPAFTTYAPKGKGRAAWKAVFDTELGLSQIRDMLLHWVSIAGVQEPKRPQIRYWRDAYGPDEKVQRVRPLEHFEYIHNPHRGTTTFQRFQGDSIHPSTASSDTYGPIAFPKRRTIGENAQYIPRTTLSYCRWPWKWLEPTKGKFAWHIIDGALAAAKAAGQTVQMRFQPYTMRWDTEKNPPKAKRFPPESSVNVPDWYWDTGARWLDAGPYAKHEPDSNDPRYLKHFGDFIRAFAARYDGHPLLESIDMAYAGFWGESGGNATAKTAATLADIYMSRFKHTQILGMLGTPACNRAVKRGYNLGWRADCLGDLKQSRVKEVPKNQAWNHTYDSYMKEIFNGGLKDAWKTAPVTMETCWTVASWMMYGFDLDMIIEQGYKYHTSVFMPKSVFFTEKSLEKLIPFDRKIGYRFALRQLLLPLQMKVGERHKIECFIDNVGCAPIYRPYAVALRFTQGRTTKVVRFAEDIRTWLPGNVYFEEFISLPRGFQRGEVKVALGIVDDHDTPCVWFAITGKTDAGWHPLTSVDAV